jgi:hypothetical protein
VKSSLASDRGELEVSPGLVWFSGRKNVLDIRAVRRVSLTGFYWPTLTSVALANVLCLIGAGLFFNFFTLDNPATYLMLLLIDLFALAIWPWRWVQIEHAGEKGEPARAYFADGRLGRNFGGTRRLADLIRQHVTVEA